jgi:hypothetical protein
MDADPVSRGLEAMAKLLGRGRRRSRLSQRWEQRLLNPLLAIAFIGVHYAFLPFHLLTEEHHNQHIDHSVGHVHFQHSHAPTEDGRERSHDSHPASDHKLTCAVLRSPPVPALDHAVLASSHVVLFVDPAPRACPLQVPLIEPRPPPLLSPHQPRAPPAA